MEDSDDDISFLYDNDDYDYTTDSNYIKFFNSLLLSYDTISLAKLKEYAREYYLLKDDEDEMNRLKELLLIKSKKYVLYNKKNIWDIKIKEYLSLSETFFTNMIKHKYKNLYDKINLIETINIIDNKYIGDIYNKTKTKFLNDSIDTDEKLMFHGTHGKNEESILTNNFDLNKGVRFAFGKGIYLSEYINVALMYGHTLLLCKVLPGKIQHYTNVNAKLNRLTYDSFSFWKNDDYSSWVIKDSNQILPISIIKVNPLYINKLKSQ